MPSGSQMLASDPAEPMTKAAKTAAHRSRCGASATLITTLRGTAALHSATIHSGGKACSMDRVQRVCLQQQQQQRRQQPRQTSSARSSSIRGGSKKARPHRKGSTWVWAAQVQAGGAAVDGSLDVAPPAVLWRGVQETGEWDRHSDNRRAAAMPAAVHMPATVQAAAPAAEIIGSRAAT